MNTAEHPIKIGVVGFSRNQFDKKAAASFLRKYLTQLTSGKDKKQVEVVSGYTNSGVPRIAYQIADEMGLSTVGYSAKQALRVRSGVYPVKKKILVGNRFGDESEKFVRYIDVLVRIGGGQQSRHEVELFRELHAGEDLDQLLFEEEVTWYGR